MGQENKQPKSSCESLILSGAVFMGGEIPSKRLEFLFIKKSFLFFHHFPIAAFIWAYSF